MSDDDRNGIVFDHFEDLFKLARYAPGDYQCRCATCHATFGGDKRAGNCFECATSIIRRAAMSAVKQQ